MRIRPATENDASAVTALWTEAYSGRGEGEGRTAPYKEREFFAAIERSRVFVAELAGEAVAVVAFAPPQAPGRIVAADGEAELSRLAVAGRARGRGIGRALVELCTEQARHGSASALVLWSRPYQVDAHRLYESLGYRRAPARDSRDEEGARLVLSLDLGDDGGPGC